MADNSILAPFTNLVTGQGNPPMNQQTQDLNKHIIEQMTGRYQADHMPNPGGPYGWMGAASDATKMFTTPMLLNAYRKAQEQIGQQGKTGAQGALFNQDSSSGQGNPPLPEGASLVRPPSVPTTTGSIGGPNSDDYISKLIQIESNGNPSARTGSYRGLGQFSKSEEAKYGINDSNWQDPATQTKALQAKTADEAEQFKAKMGRYPTAGEQYLIHQQGIGGATNHLQFPDDPAWVNMYRTAEGRQKGEGWAKQAIGGNLPPAMVQHLGGVDNIKSGDFSTYWMNKFQGIAPPMGGEASSEQQIDPTGRMNAAAPKPPDLPPTGSTTSTPGTPPPAAAAEPDATPGTEETPPGANPVRMAQNTGQPGSPNSFAGPGNGVAMPNLENSKQFGDMFMGMYRMGIPPDKIMEYINDYRKRATTELLPGPTGVVPKTNRPQDQGGPVMGQPIPQIGERQFPHISIHGIQVPLMPYGTNAKGEPVFKSAVGDVGGGDTPKTISEWAEFGRQQQALDTGVSKNADAMAEMRNKIQDEGSGLNAGATNVEIQKMLSLSKSFNPERGPTAAWTTKVREFISNMRSEEQESSGLTPDYVRRATANELAQKFQTYLSFAMAKTLNTNRITNLSLQEALQANPNAMQTKEGMESLLDLLGQDMQRKMGLAKEVGQLPISRNNEIPEISRKYMASHPAIYRDKEKGDLYMKDYEGAEDEAAKLPVGSRFTYKGQIMKVKPKDATKRPPFKPIPGVTP